MKASTTTVNRNIARLQLISRLIANSAPGADQIESVLADVVGAFGLDETGIRWPISSQQPQVSCVAGKSNGEANSKCGPEIASRLSSAKSCDDFIVDHEDPSRLLFPLIVDGRRNGLFWVVSHDGLSDEDRQLLIVLAQCISRHSSFLDRIGAQTDQSRIATRIHDTAQVAGKIAHDFDNIFTGVVGFAEIALSLLERGTLPHQYVSEIHAAGARGTQFTQQLHSLSRSGLSRPLPTTVNSVLSREETRLRKSTKGIRLQFIVPPDMPAVAVDAGALQIAVSHLLDNAVEASPPSGLVRVTAALIELSDLEAREFLGAAAAGPFIEICVGDEGPGIRDDHRKRMFFEPLFTTKVRHRGLGLSVVYRIVQAHRGGIRFDTAPGRGSVFQMVLPLAAARTAEPGTARLEVTRTPGGNAT